MSGKVDKERYWYGQIELWQQSGQTQVSYCNAQGISFATFGYWRKRYNRTTKCVRRTRLDDPGTQSSVSKVLNHPALQILLPNGVRLGVNNEASSTMLELVFRMVSHAET